MTADFRWGIAVLSFAGFVQGLTGFGFGLVAMALLPLFLPLPLASLVVVLFNVPVPLLTLWANRRGYDARRGLGLIIGTCCGVPLGFYLLTAAPEPVLLRLLGAVMIAFSLHELWPRRARHRANNSADDNNGNHNEAGLPSGLGFPLGVASGVLGGAFNVGGPPAIAYVYSRSWPREQAVAVLQVAFVLAAMLRLGLSGVQGDFSTATWSLLLWAALPVGLALWLGTRCVRALAPAHLRRGVFGFLGAMGLKYLLWP